MVIDLSLLESFFVSLLVFYKLRLIKGLFFGSGLRHYSLNEFQCINQAPTTSLPGDCVLTTQRLVKERRVSVNLLLFEVIFRRNGLGVSL